MLSIYLLNVTFSLFQVPPSAKFTLPEGILKQKPVVVEVVYKPQETSIVKQAIAEGCQVFLGVEMLLEQGFEQFQLWTKCDALQLENLKKDIRSRVLEFASL